MSTSKGTFVQLTIATKKFIGESSLSLAMAVSMIETSSKASGDASTFVAGRIAETISVSSMGTSDGAPTAQDVKLLRSTAVAGAAVAFVITEYTSAGAVVTGSFNIAGNALISNVSADFPDNDKITLSVDLQVTGATTTTTN